MADDAPTEDLSAETQVAEEPQPEKLRVHSLARVLGTTSKRVLDALTELDGRPRSAQSAVEEDEVERVRAALADRPAESDAAAEIAVCRRWRVDARSERRPSRGESPTPTRRCRRVDEPESRLMLETAAPDVPERAEYMPLFVAPQPVRFEYHDPDDDDDDEDDDDDRRRPGRRPVRPAFWTQAAPWATRTRTRSR